MSKYMQGPATLYTRFEEIQNCVPPPTPLQYIAIVQQWLVVVRETDQCENIKHLIALLVAGEV